MPAAVLLRLGRRYISRRLLQSLLFVLGVTLGVAMVIAIDLANASATRAFALTAESISGRATHQVIGGPAGLDEDVYRRLRLELGLRESAPVIDQYVRAPELGNQPMRMLGVDPLAEPPFRAYIATAEVIGQQGDAGEALNAFIALPGSILISQRLAERFGVEPGGLLQLQVGDRVREAQIVGVLRPSDDVSGQALDNLLLADIATAQELLGTPGRISRIDLILPEGYDTAQITAILPAGAQLTTPTDSASALSQMTDAFNFNLQALSLLALVVGVFLIYNTVTFSVIQRRPLIGILRALGATRAQIFGLILGEAALLGLIGTVLGLAVGIIFGRGALGLVSRSISDLYFTVTVQGLTVPPETLLKGALIGLAASLVAALIPSIEATRTPPAGNLRRSDAEDRARKLIPLMTVGGVLANVVGVLLLRVPSDSLVISFGGLFCVVIGSALFTPGALMLVMRLLSPVTGRLFGVLGRMAPRAVTRSLSRTSIAVAALTIAVSVIVGVSAMIGSFRLTVSDWLDQTLDGDIYISPSLLTVTSATANTDPAVLDRLRAVPGVASLSHVRSVRVIAPEYPDLPPVNLNVFDVDSTRSGRPFVWNAAAGGDYWAAMEGGAVIVSEPFAFRRGITQANNQITLLTDQGARTFPVVGVYYDYSSDQGAVMMTEGVYRPLWDDRFITSIALFVEPGVDVRDVIDTVQREALVGLDLRVQSFGELRSGVFQVFDQTFAITAALQLLATVVAFIGVLSALMSLQLEQTRQYGVMRATGMLPGQLWMYTLLQTGLMGLTAGLLALPIGLALALVLIEVINVRSFGWSMQLALQPQEFIQAFSVAVIAALAAGVYPALRISQILPGRALRAE
jgi:putative ABC transport system permease protein